MEPMKLQEAEPLLVNRLAGRKKQQTSLWLKSFVRFVVIGLVAQSAFAEGKTTQERIGLEQISFSLFSGFNQQQNFSDTASTGIHLPREQNYQLDVNGIASLFDDVEESLQEAISMFNTSSEQDSSHVRKARDTENVLVRRAQCTVSKEKLVGLKYEIKFALRNADATQSAITCDIDSNNSDNCNEIMKLIQCGVDHLKRGFMEASANGASLEEISKWKNAYDDLLVNYNRGIDDAKQAATQESQHKLDEIKTNLQTLGNELNIKIEELKKRVLELCSSEIHSERIRESVECFKKLNDYAKVPEVIRDSYDFLSTAEANDSSKKMKNVGKILKFIQNLPSVHQAAAYQSLYDSMLSNKHLDTFEVLGFDEAIGERLARESNLSSGLKGKLSYLRGLLSPHVSNVIRFWARNKDYEKIKSYARKSDLTKRTIDDRLQTIVETLYTDLSSFDAVVKFANELQGCKSTGLAYKALLKEMKSRDHLYGHSEIMKLAYKVQRVCYNSDTEARNIFADLKTEIPSSVTEVIGSSVCFIRNFGYFEYFYAGSWWHKYDETRRQVFTWVPGDRDDDYKWRIETDNDGDSFILTNIDHNEVLHSPGGSKVYTWIGDSNFLMSYGKYWKLEPTAHLKFRIKNTGSNEYLYAMDGKGDIAGNRRAVGTGSNPSNSEWIFYCD